MKKLTLGLALLAASASAGEIFPNPQVFLGIDTSFPTASATYRLVGEETADADAVRALKNALPISDSGTIEIIIGEKGDEAVAAFVDKIPAEAQGYYLKVLPESIVIAGADEVGTYYGVQSFLQLTEGEEVPCSEVQDWPTIKDRGVIEGYYGNPWSQEDCLDMYGFFDRNKMNTFIYGPKNDAYHKSKWAEPYPADKAAELKQLAEEGLKHKVHFVWAMHPGNAIEGDNMAKAKAKFQKMYDLGIRQFGVFFDDINANSVKSQIEYLNYINREIVHSLADVKPLIVCPTEYCISFAGGWNTASTYLNEMGQGCDPDIQIMFTGAGVVDMGQVSAADWFKTKTGRKPYIWLNYPVNDYGYEGGPLLMSPYQAPDADLPERVEAFCSNPMEYYEASKVALYGIGDYCWNPEKYDADSNWLGAIGYLFPNNAEAFKTYCQSNFYYPQCTHGLVVKWHETPEFKALIDADATISATTAEAYRAYFEKQIATADELLSLTDNRLVNEIKEWIEVYRMQGERGVLLTDMFQAIGDESASGFIAAYESYKALTDSADVHYSRDGWDVRRYLPKSAPEYVRGWMTKTAGDLVQAFKNAGYDYPAGLFPYQVLETGTYYILYNGLYLSNGSGAKADTPSYPKFSAEVDDINPARQSWRIAYDSEKGRYSIRSVFDDRYINELGNFGTNAFENNWHTFEIMPLGELYSIRNAESAGKNFWYVPKTNRIEKNSRNAYNVANFQFQIVSADEVINPRPKTWTPREYYFFNNDGQALKRNTNDSLDFVELPEEPAKNLKWDFRQDENGRISIYQGSKFINEKGVISVNPFSAQWNTYELYMTPDGKVAIRNADSAGTEFWTLAANGKITKGGQPFADSLVFGLKPTADDSSINEIHAPAADGKTYDLQGRQVLRPGTGLYIQNGKKIIK